MLMSFEKVGSLLKGYTVDGKYVGGFDFQTNSWVIKKRGSGIRRNMPLGFNTNMISAETSALSVGAQALVSIWDRNQARPWCYNNINDCFAWIEKLISVGLRPDSVWEIERPAERLEGVKLTKDFVQFCKDNYYGCFRKSIWDKWKRDNNYKDLIENYGSDFFNYCYSISESVKGLSTRKNLEKLCRVIQRENVHYLTARTDYIVDGLRDYFMLHPEEAIPSRNFLLELSTARRVCKDNENKMLEKRLKLYNDLPCLYYETDEWFARPLITPVMFHDEAEQQNNCVERMYMSKVANGETNVVQIRRKNAPNKSWITVEVHFGTVRQFLKRFNENVKDGSFEAKVRDVYIQHLKASWVD